MKINYKDYVADVKDFPIEGILFRDITPLMANGEVFKQACDELTSFAKELNIDVVAGPGPSNDKHLGKCLCCQFKC